MLYSDDEYKLFSEGAGRLFDWDCLVRNEG